jgi:hypothetical protein
MVQLKSDDPLPAPRRGRGRAPLLTLDFPNIPEHPFGNIHEHSRTFANIREHSRWFAIAHGTDTSHHTHICWFTTMEGIYGPNDPMDGYVGKCVLDGVLDGRLRRAS